MKLDLNGMGIEVTEGMKEYAEKKVAKLDKFFDKDTIAHVTFSAKKEKQYVSIRVEAKGKTVNEKHLEQIKGMSAGIENISWFFCQVLFVGGSGALLVQGTLANLGYDVPLIRLAAVEIPVAVTGVAVGVIYYWLKDRRLCRKYYGKEK